MFFILMSVFLMRELDYIFRTNKAAGAAVVPAMEVAAVVAIVTSKRAMFFVRLLCNVFVFSAAESRVICKFEACKR